MIRCAARGPESWNLGRLDNLFYRCATVTEISSRTAAELCLLFEDAVDKVGGESTELFIERRLEILGAKFPPLDPATSEPPVWAKLLSAQKETKEQLAKRFQPNEADYEQWKRAAAANGVNKNLEEFLPGGQFDWALRGCQESVQFVRFCPVLFEVGERMYSFVERSHRSILQSFLPSYIAL